MHALERRCHTHPWNLRHFVSTLRDPTTRVVVLRASNVIVAYCVVQVAADEMHIHNLVVCPERRRQGLARWLLRDALEWGSEAGARRAFLEVRHSNWAALGLYRAAGFEAVSTRRDYYDRPREDALVLRRDILEPNP